MLFTFAPMTIWFKETLGILAKEWRLEWRQKYALVGLMMYALVMVFAVSLVSGGDIEPSIWNMLFWILLLFVSVNAVAKSFMAESKGQVYYLYTLAGPTPVLSAKLLFNFLVLLAAGLVSFTGFIFFSPIEIGNISLFLLGLVAGCLGFSVNLTLVSSITAGAGNKSTLFAVLSFPLTLPLLMASMKVTETAIEGKGIESCLQEFAFIPGFIVIIAAVSFILFPSLWRE